MSHTFASVANLPSTSDDNEIVHKGFTRGDLFDAFSRVESPDGWKHPISAWVDAENLSVTMAAIEFYAGGGCIVDGVGALGTRLRIKAPGYYATIGA